MVLILVGMALLPGNLAHVSLKLGAVLSLSYIVVYFVGKKLRQLLTSDSQQRKEVNVWVVALILLVFPFLWIYFVLPGSLFL